MGEAVTIVRPVKAVLTSHEGTGLWAGRVLADASAGPDFWLRSSEALRRFSYEEARPKMLGALKVDVDITFEDGHVYQANLSVRHPSHQDNDCDLAAHVSRHVLFMAGLLRPSYLSSERYAAALREYERALPGSQEAHRRFLERYITGAKSEEHVAA